MRIDTTNTMNAKGAVWIGGGVVAAIGVPVIASFCLALAHVLRLPVGALREFPTAMLLLWGPVFAFVFASPVAFVLGAWAARRAPTPRDRIGEIDRVLGAGICRCVSGWWCDLGSGSGAD